MTVAGSCSARRPDLRFMGYDEMFMQSKLVVIRFSGLEFPSHPPEPLLLSANSEPRSWCQVRVYGLDFLAQIIQKCQALRLSHSPSFQTPTR